MEQQAGWASTACLDALMKEKCLCSCKESKQNSVVQIFWLQMGMQDDMAWLLHGQ
jgi:hypothetical protein